ncbi:MAG: family 10 glycosylhydrolase [Bacteroidota bacterium]
MRSFEGILLVSLGLLICSCQENQPYTTPPPQPTRGVWLTNVVSDAMFSRAQIEAAVERCHQYGFNSIFVVTWNRGYTLYPSDIMEQTFGLRIDPQHQGRDPLQEVIDAARTRGMKVYAWFEFGFAASYQEADGGPLLRQKPRWAARDSAGNIASKNGFQWMNAFDPAVQDFILSLLKEVVSNYDIDGVQGDDRLPALPSIAGYDSLTVAAYRQSHQGASPPRDPFNTEWVDWRAQRLNVFMERLHREVKAVDSTTTISVSPSIFPWSKEQYLQDWPRWVAEGWVDMVCPQIYRYDLDKYRLELKKIMEEQVEPTNHHLIFPGILARVGDYYATDTLLQLFVKENRKYGIEGEVFFYYEALQRNEQFYQNLYF